MASDREILCVYFADDAEEFGVPSQPLRFLPLPPDRPAQTLAAVSSFAAADEDVVFLHGAKRPFCPHPADGLQGAVLRNFAGQRLCVLFPQGSQPLTALNRGYLPAGAGVGNWDSAQSCVGNVVDGARRLCGGGASTARKKRRSSGGGFFSVSVLLWAAVVGAMLVAGIAFSMQKSTETVAVTQGLCWNISAASGFSSKTSKSMPCNGLLGRIKEKEASNSKLKADALPVISELDALGQKLHKAKEEQQQQQRR